MIGNLDRNDGIMISADQDERLRLSEQFRPSELQLKNEEMPRLQRIHLDNSLSNRKLSSDGVYN